MRLSTRARASTLAAVAAVVLLACRAPSGGVEDDPALAGHGADAAAPHAARPQSDASEPTTRAVDQPAEAAPPARDPAASGDTVPPAPSDPAPVGSTTAVDEPSPTSSKPSATEAEPERPSKTCRRPGPHYTGPLRDLVGLDEAAVRRCLGDPDRTEGSTWHYRWPQGCAYEVSRVVVRFARGKVASAHAKHEITGQHCGSDF